MAQTKTEKTGNIGGRAGEMLLGYFIQGKNNEFGFGS